MNNKKPIEPTDTIKESNITNLANIRIIPKLNGGMKRKRRRTKNK